MKFLLSFNFYIDSRKSFSGRLSGQKILLQNRNMDQISKRYLFTSYSRIYNLVVLYSYLVVSMAIILSPFLS